MKELSMHILDIATNSVRADATKVTILVKEDLIKNEFIFEIEDNGKGIPEEMLATIKNPFTTSRTLRNVGLGIPLLNDNCKLCGGYLTIESEVGVGTKLKSMMVYDNIDRPPMGDIASTMCGLISSNEAIEIDYSHWYNQQCFELTTSELKEALDGVSLTEVSVMQWLKNFINESIDEIKASE